MVTPQKARMKKREIYALLSTHHAISVLTPEVVGLKTLTLKPHRPYGMSATTHQPPIPLQKPPLVSTSLRLMKKHSALAKACKY
jgi:hypothetical protein